MLTERASELCALLGLPRVYAFETVTSTQDIAHERATDGAAAGTLVVADAQTAGRGRQGRSWRSEAGRGVWLSMIERPVSVTAVDVLSLRVGLRLAGALEGIARSPVRLKWPNDLMLDDRKLGGILIEARWREGRVEHVAIGVGINLMAPPSEARAIGLGEEHSAIDVLRRVVPAIRAAAERAGGLDGEERAEFEQRDWLRGRRSIAPVAGTVIGIDSSGALLVDSGAGLTAVRAGELVLAEGS